jgi:CheY-like chemotaxis protein
MKSTDTARRFPGLSRLEGVRETLRARPSRAGKRSARPILCAEDDAGEIAWLSYAFKAAEIRNPVHFVGSGRQAIRYLAGASKSLNSDALLFPCLVLLGLHLRGPSGFQVLEWIRAQPALKTLVVVILSTSQEPAGLAGAYRLRANSFVLKPPDLAKHLELARLLKAWWLEEDGFPGSGRPEPDAGGLREHLAFCALQ